MSPRFPVARRDFLRRGALLAAAAAVPRMATVAGAGRVAGGAGPIDPPALAFVRTLAADTVGAARVQPGQSRGAMGPNRTGCILTTPGGRYPALWTRDLAMSLDCGLIDAQESLPQLRLIARCQNGAQERRLGSGAIIPPYAIVDHVTLAGGAVFYPGTYSDGDDQGAAPWGPLPPIDNHFFFVHIAHAIWRTTGDSSLLGEIIDGVTLLDRLERAFASPASDPRTGAAVTDERRRAVGFGFQDTVHLLGSMAFATLLRFRAARQLASLCRAGGRPDAAARYVRTAGTIAAHVASVFEDPAAGGWLLAATAVGRQPDVWATLFALHLGVLPAGAAERARRAVASAVRAPGHTIEYRGAVRHVPSDRYFRPDQCWEAGGGRVHTYQSGAFWHTPTGWLIEALDASEPALARQVCDRFVDHLRAEDFRKGDGRGAPWECFGPDMAAAQNPVYMTSVTLPLAVLETLGAPRR